MKEFFTSWTNISTLLNFILVCFSIWQIQEAKKEEAKRKSQVKIWQQSANGISQALKRIVVDVNTNLYTSVHDVCNAVWSVEASVFALYQSLYEERVVSEKEYKQQQEEFSKEVKKRMQIGGGGLKGGEEK